MARCGQWAFGLTAVVLLGYSAMIWVDALLFQAAESRQFEKLLQAPQLRLAAGHDAMAPVAAGGLIGRIEIPRLGVSVMVVEGVDRRALGRAAGHIPGTAQPGQPGNVGISAHRDTFFRPLRNIRAGDLITVSTAGGEYEYRVVSTKVTTPSDVSVLDTDGREMLTLVTCYPFYFIGSAPERFIVRAQRLKAAARSSGPSEIRAALAVDLGV
jgi:sortase A